MTIIFAPTIYENTVCGPPICMETEPYKSDTKLTMLGQGDLQIKSYAWKELG